MTTNEHPRIAYPTRQTAISVKSNQKWSESFRGSFLIHSRRFLNIRDTVDDQLQDSVASSSWHPDDVLQNDLYAAMPECFKHSLRGSPVNESNSDNLMEENQSDDDLR
ncbi:hypothetical protein Agabi119p4_8476 [Agaricus bisporus var. burnettii]|uniref:Uncharacterized protein n=1 Tax=Agaricus bisporus var. burnettii TaxID=192524 RepID=A0A8H7C782_AGABI|nr:hypothetical protein Agabi119p4_8476 [Agaricus bisporus var. burnettii]